MTIHNDWTGDMRRRLARREVPAPDNMWEKIEARLDATDHTTANKQKTHRLTGGATRAIIWALSAAAAVALLVTVGYHANEDTINRLASTTPDKPQHTDRTDTAPIPHPTVADTYTALAQLPTATAAISAATPSTRQGTQQEANEAPSGDEPEIHDMPIEPKCAHEKPAADTRHNTRQQLPPSVQQQAQATAYQYSEPAKTARLAIGIHAGGIIADNRSTAYPGIRTLMSPTLTAIEEFAGNNIAARYKETKHHSQPITIGLSVAYALNDRLSITTGAVYTRATTDFIKSAGSDDIVESQKLHYIGVPLGVKYRVWGNSLVQTYATAGGEADFNVSATSETSGKSVDVKHDRVQMSANAAAGIQVNVAPHVGVFAEPGVKYYFDNKSSVVTIFKDKPWSFNMNVGLRVDL